MPAFGQTIISSPQVESDPANIWFDEGNALYNQSKYDDAIQAYDMAIELNPQDAAAWNNKGVALTDELYHILLRQEYPAAHLYHAVHEQKYDEAIQCFGNALNIDPQDAGIWANKALALNKRGRFVEALQTCNKAIELNPYSAVAWNNLGIIYYDTGYFGAALTAYDKALELAPSCGVADTYAIVSYNKNNDLKALGLNSEADNAYDMANVCGWRGPLHQYYYYSSQMRLYCQGISTDKPYLNNDVSHMITPNEEFARFHQYDNYLG